MNGAMSRRRLLALGAVVTTAYSAFGTTSAMALPAGTCAFNPHGPSRLADTRPGAAVVGFVRLDASTVRVTVAGRNGVPSNASAAVLNITATNVRGPGFVTVYPTGSGRPTASNVNVEYVGQTIPNLVTVSLGLGGAVDIYSQADADLIIDLMGSYTPVSVAVSAGRFVGFGAAARVLDTRSRGYGVGAGQTERINLASRVPASAVAVVVNLTVTQSLAGGHWTAFPLGSSLPNSSNLNTDGKGQTRPNQAIVALGTLGAQRGIDVFSATGGHLLVDVAGYFTGAADAASTVGLFVPSSPDRRLDTRRAGSYGLMHPGWTAEFDFPGRSASQSVVVNLTTTATRGPGHFTAFAARTVRPEASNLNASYANQTIANHAIVPTSSIGVAVFTAGGGHVIADVAGYFTGTPVAATTSAAANIVPLPPPGPALPYILAIPKIGVRGTVVAGITDAIVDAGYVGHWTGTGLAGEDRHMLLFAHRTSANGLFRYIHLLTVGDEISLTVPDGRVFRYRYARRQITSPSAVEIMNAASVAGSPTVSLVACTKADYTPTSLLYRLVVTFQQI